MTTYNTDLMRCGVCGAESPQAVWTSTSSFGWPDLDNRPSEPERSSIFLWVQECPGCGYCAHSLEHGTEDLQGIIHGDAYRALITDRSCAVNAAWVCDDERASDAAANARLRAVELFRLEIAEGGGFGDSEEIGDQLAEEHAFLAELLRRAGRPADARDECSAGLEHCVDERLEALIKFQLALLDGGDAARHSFGELSERS